MKLVSLSLLALSLPLAAQGVFMNVDKPGDPICRRVFREVDSLNTSRGSAQASLEAFAQQGRTFIAPDQRKDVSAFGVADEKGKVTTLAELKGKTVLIGLWSTKCDPSGRMIQELSDIYGKRAQFNFEILAVNFDENRPGENEGGWRAIKAFQVRNRAFFEKSNMPVFVPGLGAQGPSVLMEMVYSLPALFVVDPQGRLAIVEIGYTPNYIARNLSQIVRESQAPAAPKQ